MIDPKLAKNAPMDDAVDVFKYAGKYKRDFESSEKVPVDKMDPSKFVHVCRFPVDKIRTFFSGGGDIMYADSVMAARRPHLVSLKERFCLPGTSAMREPDFGCSAKEYGNRPACYMKVKMDPESRFESGSPSAYHWSPPYYWGEKKLLPKEWAARVYPGK